jgi:hypothetical protein
MFFDGARDLLFYRSARTTAVTNPLRAAHELKKVKTSAEAERLRHGSRSPIYFHESTIRAVASLKSNNVRFIEHRSTITDGFQSMKRTWGSLRNCELRAQMEMKYAIRQGQVDSANGIRIR